MSLVTTLDRLPAAVTQRKAHPARSERYVHINTHKVIDALKTEGFVVNAVQVTRSKSNDPLFARHQVDMRYAPGREPAKHGAAQPRFLFTNSHDGTTSAQLRLGLYVYACTNGLVIGTDYARQTVRHSGDAAAELIDRVRALAKNTAPMFQQIDRWQRKELTPGQERKFAELASVLRWGDPHRYPTEEVLKVRRREDDNRSLWSVFNRVQENAMRGGLHGLSPTGRKATSRPLSDIANSNDFNSQLWRLAGEFAEI